MNSGAATERYRHLLGVGVSVLAHVAVVVACPAAPASVVAAPPVEAALIWLEGTGAAPGSSEAAGDVPAAGSEPAAGAMRASAPPAPRGRRLAPASAATAVDAAAAAPLAVAEGTPTAPEGEGVAPSGAGAEAGSGVGAGTGRGSHAGASGGTGGSGTVHGPRLLAGGNPCAGYFPTGADVAHGRVQIEVEVGPNGRIASTRVMAEQPLGAGFAGAARACAEERLRFTPARTSEGTPVAGHARLLLGFDRT